MIRTAPPALLHLGMLIVCVFGIEQHIVNVPLDYNYLPGEPFWAKYGAVDGRGIDLWIHVQPEKNLGDFTIDGTDNFILVPEGVVEEYVDRAVSKVLTRYGVAIGNNYEYRLVITPERIEILSEDHDEDGDKHCIVNLRADYFGPDSTHLFSAIVENEGSLGIDDDDETEYANFLDRTLHGAIVKIWGSQVLYTNEPLGTGYIRKVNRGAYAFIGDTTIHETTRFPDAGTLWHPSQFRHPDFSRLPDAPPGSFSGGIPAGGATITGTRNDETVVIVSGRRISVGILPFENATGNERLTAIIKSTQERFSSTLERSGTIRIMERSKLSDILKEQALGLSGIMNDSTVVKIGNVSGLQVMAAGVITTSGSCYRLSARLINVETSVIVASTSLLVTDALRVDEAGAELAAQLLFKFTEEKLNINRNTMAYPAVNPRAIPAATAAVEDAWAVLYNPAAIMKVALRDAAFFTSFAEKITGTTPDGATVSTRQPPYASMGLNLAYPINGFIGSGFGIRHFYRYPRLVDKTSSGGYDFREEATAFTLPVAIGIHPKLSIGAGFTATISEYFMQQPDRETIDGSSITSSFMLGTLVKLSERFRMAATYSSADIYQKTEEKYGSIAAMTERPSTHDFCIGTAMYPVRWFFFFGDLMYRKYEHLAQLQPGFSLGAQFTVYGRPAVVGFLPEYGMVPLYIGYLHEPYDRVRTTQGKFVSFGSGYYLNNIYFQWAWRINVEKGSEKAMVLGSGDSKVRLTDYRYTAPLFFCVGYRF